MGENGLTASDVALLNNDGMNGGWGGMIWLFAILALMGGGFGNWGGNNGNAIQADVNRGFDNQNLQAQIQGLKDMIKDDKIEAMQNRINQLELQNQLQGVVRYPNGYTYTAGNNPFCGGCCPNM